MLDALVGDRHAVGLGVTGAGVDAVGALDRQVHLVRAPVQRFLLDQRSELLGAEDLLVVPEVPAALEEVLVVTGVLVAGILGAVVRVVARVVGPVVRILGPVVRVVAGALGPVLGTLGVAVLGILGVLGPAVPTRAVVAVPTRAVVAVPIRAFAGAFAGAVVVAVVGVVLARGSLFLRLLCGGLLGICRLLGAAAGDQDRREGDPGQRGQEPSAPARAQGAAWSRQGRGSCTSGAGGRVRCRGGGHDVSFSGLALGWAERSAPCTGHPTSVIPSTGRVERILQPDTRPAPPIHVSTDPSQEQT